MVTLFFFNLLFSKQEQISPSDLTIPDSFDRFCNLCLPPPLLKFIAPPLTAAARSTNFLLIILSQASNEGKG